MPSNRNEYSFTHEQLRTQVLIIDNDDTIDRITGSSRTMSMPSTWQTVITYRGRGQVCAEKKARTPSYRRGRYNYVMAVCFPKSQPKILDYNRVVKDLNGLSGEDSWMPCGKIST